MTSKVSDLTFYSKQKNTWLNKKNNYKPKLGRHSKHYWVQRCAVDEKFPGIPIPRIPGNSGSGNEKFQSMHHSRNYPFPGWEWISLEIPGIEFSLFFNVKIWFFFLTINRFIRSFYHRKENCLVYFIAFLYNISSFLPNA